jgi:hypothetical protein
LFYKIFAHPKNYVPNIEILKSSYLKFLIYVLSPSFGSTGEEVVNCLIDILKYITKKEEIKVLYKRKDGDGLDSIELRLRLDDIEINEYEFEDIREIVLEQNNLSIEYVESYNPELETHLEFMNRNSSDITLQDQIFSFCAITKFSISEIEKLTLFQFGNLMEKVINLKEFDLYKPLLASGQITLKNDSLKHYLYHSVKSGRYDSIMMDKDTFLERNKEAFG